MEETTYRNFVDTYQMRYVTKRKETFQKGTNFKDYIEEVILSDVEINFRNRKKLFHCIGDNFERIFGFKHRGMRDTLSGTENGFTKWI